MNRMAERITAILGTVNEYDRAEVRAASCRIFEEFLRQEGIVDTDERIPMLKAAWNLAIEVVASYIDLRYVGELRQETDYRLPETCSIP